MKKTRCIKVLLTLLSLTILIYPSKKSFALENNDVSKIKQNIKQYFGSEFESIKSGQAIDESKIIYNNELKEFTNLRNSREVLWHRKLNNKLYYYNIDIRYTSLNIDGDMATVNLSKDTEFSFEKTKDKVSKEFNNKHKISLKKVKDSWQIVQDKDNSEEMDVSQDNFEASNLIDSNNINEKIQSLKNSLANIDEEVNQYMRLKQNNIEKSLSKKLITNLSSFEGHTWQVDYNRSAAINYARKWAYSRNPDYTNCPADCTNFVSQAVYAGAPKMNIISNWATTSLIAGKAWVLVDNFWSFLVNNTGSGPIAMDNTHNLDIDLGDVVQLWNNDEGCYHHTIIITDMDDYGGLYYCAHTTDRKDYSLDQAYAGGAYNYDKQRTAHIFGYNN
ncbi:amidase domain-containing protein [Clostridium sp. C8-1-8]|uniref:amidase domain-containing protein n=1 Tax=Clostridium sp. C8-1-8 TaxID=2698831 RepID=UPI0019242D6F|nr:amidase domain-containing protein [Clostridium sp. C8-1-8]